MCCQKDDTIQDGLTDAIYSSVESLTNPHKLVLTTGVQMERGTSDSTIKSYLGHLEDACLIANAKRWDMKGTHQQSQYEIDFVLNTSMDKFYKQSALNVDSPEKKTQEAFSQRNTGDFCRKIVG